MESIDLAPVTPTQPPAPYIGGKHLLAPRIAERLASISHRTYAEPFVGMGGVFFRRPFRPRAEVINDISRDVVTLFRVLQRHYVPFIEMMRYQVTSRSEFERLSRTEPDTLTDLERAARFLYLQRTAFGGIVTGQGFGTEPEGAVRFDVTRLQPMLEGLHERLAGVVIECLPFPNFIERYDKPATLFYLDPPYWGSETDYGKSVFERADFKRLAEQLGQIEGKFMLSINDVEAVREMFADFVIEEIETTYTVMTLNGQPLEGSVPLDGGAEIVFAGQHLTLEGDGDLSSLATSIMSAPETSLASPRTTASPASGLSGGIRSDFSGTPSAKDTQPPAEAPVLAPAATSFVESLDNLTSEDFSGPVGYRQDEDRADRTGREYPARSSNRLSRARAYSGPGRACVPCATWEVRTAPSSTACARPKV